MTDPAKAQLAGKKAVQKVEDVRHELGPFVVAAEATRMPMVFTNAKSEQNEIVYANESFLNLTGYKAKEAIGLPFHRLVAESDRPNAKLDSIANAPKSTLDLCFLRKDHTEYDASVLVSPVCDKDGQLQQYFVCVLDLSEHIEKRLQAHIQEVEKYRYAPGFIALTEGPDHRFTFANTAYEALIGRTNLVGRRVSDVMPELADQGILNSLDEVYRTGERLIGKRLPVHLNRGPKGESETRHVNFIYEPVRDAAGAVTGLFCEGSDITEVHVASEKLNDIQNELMHVARINAMGTMAATLSHELNQPLAAIANYAAGCATLLEGDEIPVKAVQEALSRIASASLRAGDVIRSLRHMTKRSAPTFEKFDLGEAFEESVHLVQVGGCQDVTIMSRSAPSLVVLGNKIQIQQVIINLLRNACQAASTSGRPSEVLAAAKIKNGSPCIVVRDNGLGFPKKMEGDVFQWCESSKEDGMGIGLSISRTIAENHGGSIAIDKTGPSGTTISFHLPNVASEKATSMDIIRAPINSRKKREGGTTLAPGSTLKEPKHG